jgi:tRNA U34 5-carboxymethylaminomethyl modifying GTPase MnmE/TrmE
VFVYDTDKGAYADVFCSVVYEGMPLETYSSHYFKEGYENGEKTLTFYLFKFLQFSFSGKDKLEMAYIPRSYQIYEKNELNSVIGLQGAVELLKNELAKTQKDKTFDSDQAVVTNLRHYQALSEAAGYLEKVSLGITSGTPTELLAEDLRQALNQLGTITGEVTSDDILGEIFSRFCIGK